MFISHLFENSNQPSILVVYAGRFQPFHKGHHAVYNWLATKYGRNNVFIATSNKVDGDRSPFSFSDKSYFMHLTGIPGDCIVETRVPYQPKELLSKYNPATTLVLFAVSEKDMASRFPIRTNKDGSASYFQHLPANLKDAKTFNEHAYLIEVPKFNFEVLGQPMDSASDIRKLYSESNAKTRQAIITDLFGHYTPEAQHIMDEKLGGKPQRNVVVPKVGKMYEEAAGVGLVRGGNDPRYVMATTGDQNDVNSKTLGKMMKAYKLVGQKTTKTGQAPVKSNIAESYDSVSAVENAIIRRIMSGHLDLLAKFGPKDIMDAARDVAEWVGDVDEIGSSDVSGWVMQVERDLQSRGQGTVDEAGPDSLEDKLRLELGRTQEVDEQEGYWDQEDQDHGLFVTIGNEEDGMFVGMVYMEGGEWRESNLHGTPPHGWGSKRYMSYLTPNDIKSYIKNDYGRHNDVKFFNDEESAINYADSMSGNDDDYYDDDMDEGNLDPSGLLAAASMVCDYIITAEVDGKTKKFRVRGMTGPRAAKERFLKHHSMAKVLDVKAEEGVNEVSQSTRDRYVARASDDFGHATFAARAAKSHPGSEQYGKEQEARAKKRATGLNRALSDKRRGVEEGSNDSKIASLEKKLQAVHDRISMAKEKRRMQAQKGRGAGRIQSDTEVKLHALASKISQELHSLKQGVAEGTGVTDYNPKSQGGTRKELLAKYHKTKNPKDAEAARKAGATQKELQGVAEGPEQIATNPKQCYTLGVNAHRSGKKWDDNPFKPGSSSHKHWRNGWFNSNDQKADVNRYDRVYEQGVAEAESAPVDTQKLQQALDTVQQFAGVASKFSKEQKYQFNDIVSNLYRLGEQWKALNLGTTGSDVDDALQEAMEAVNRALSEIYGIDEAVKYVARSINNSIEDAESEAEWARKYPDDK